VKVLVLPRDSNPYQALLYGEMQRLGVQVAYIGELTASRTLNVLLLPLEVVARRVAGARVVHLHWVFAFALPGARRIPALRRLTYLWFLVWLKTCRTLGMHLIWTAHNVLPHEPVFADDVSARKALVKACDLVVAHSPETLAELAALGVVPRKSAVIQHGPMAPAMCAASLRNPGAGSGPRRFLFFGRVKEYKGVDDLLVGFLAMPDDVPAHLTIAGQCDDPGLRSRLRARAQRGGANVVLRLERVPDEEVTHLLAAADVVVLPFRRVTTSGSAMLALSHGRPLIVPCLAGLTELPDQAIFRYDGEVSQLIAVLTQAARTDGETLAAMSAAARDYASRMTWREIAEKTICGISSMFVEVPRGNVRREPRRSRHANSPKLH
jgi:glycosyltransferase involved in cell wall biosynthesis